MPDEPDKPEHAPLPESVNCAVCRKEISRMDAIKDEGGEYVRWFCGFDCYHHWKTNNSSAKQGW